MSSQNDSRRGKFVWTSVDEIREVKDVVRGGTRMSNRECRCGCGEETMGGKFKPGHDQKLRAALEEAVGGLESLRSIVEEHVGRPVVGSRSK